MSKKILLAGMFSVAVLAIVLFRIFSNNPDEFVGPVLVPLYESTDEVSLRGLHATDDTVVVVGGNQGVFGFSLDAGVHWIFSQLPDAGESQFRSVWAHNDHTFLAVSAGAPSYVYYSEDRGQSWLRTFEDTAQATFLDGITFVNDTIGFIYGDPVDGRFKLLRTADGGKSWTDVVGPEAIDGEASFAASGSAIAVGNNLMSIVTGGTVSRLHVTMDLRDGQGWTASPIELAQGLPSQGAFAHHWEGEKLYIVGGDYMEEDNTYGTALVANLMTGQDDTQTMEKLASLPYTSDVCGDGEHVYFTGTTGVRYLDSTLHVMDTTAMHALASSGKYVFASGPKGRIGRVFKGTIAELNELVAKIETAHKR
jgi:photosystem II stability/assembly factor-like uncharacterized protein